MAAKLLDDRVRPYVQVLLISIIAFFAGEAVFNVMAVRSIGSIFRYNLKTLVALIALFMYCNNDFLLSAVRFKRSESFKKSQLLYAVVAALCIGLIVCKFSNLGVVRWALVLFVAVSVGVSIRYVFSNNLFFALLIFWIAYPFLYFIQHDVAVLGFRNVGFMELYLPWSGVYIAMLFACIVVVKFSRKELLSEKKYFFLLWIIPLSSLSLFFSTDPAKSFVYLLFDIFIPLLCFYITAASVKNRRQAEQILRYMFLSLITLLLITMYLYYKNGMETANTFRLYNAVRTIISPGQLAGLTVIMICFAPFLYRFGSRLTKTCLVIAFAFLIFTSEYRSIVLALSGMIALYFIMSSTRLSKKILIILCAITCCFLLFTTMSYLDISLESKHRLIETYR
ncbi:hypothetical protein ACFL42_04210, partial [Candidatus Omnitrophota bacterium]